MRFLPPLGGGRIAACSLRRRSGLWRAIGGADMSFAHGPGCRWEAIAGPAKMYEVDATLMSLWTSRLVLLYSWERIEAER